MAVTIIAVKAGTQPAGDSGKKAGGQGVNVQLSHPVGCTEEVKDLSKKQTMLLCAVETPSAKTEGGVITGSAMIEDLIISVKAKILRWIETGFFPNSFNLAMRVPLTRLDTEKDTPTSWWALPRQRAIVVIGLQKRMLPILKSFRPEVAVHNDTVPLTPMHVLVREQMTCARTDDA
ncbi:hypothetical protein B0H14DRAFT_2594423 [Mycena olivaceomarginata]|nr:hypothetical protein B0H14DRAFT_2594423 [Mycena olivaceomarginata]